MFLLICFLIYVSSIMLRVVLEGSNLGDEYFSSVSQGMGTLLLDGTLSGSKGVHVIRQAYSENPVYAIAFLLFVLLANVTMMGVLTGCLVQTVRTIATVEHEQKSVTSIAQWMEDLWDITLDHGTDEIVSAAELESILSVEETA